MDAHKKLTTLEMKLLILLPASTSPDLLLMDSTTNTPNPTLVTILGLSSQVTVLTLLLHNSLWNVTSIFPLAQLPPQR